MQNLKTVDFDVAFTLTRPAPADYEDKDGNTQTAAANEPRFNYSNGVAQGLMLDASLSETAAIDDVPAFNASAGHWIIDAEFFNSEPLKGMGLNEVFVGSGKMVVSYSGGTAKVWAGGQAVYTVASYTPVEPTHICEGGMATIASLSYKPTAISDADAAALATGDFELTPFAPDELFANGEKGAWYDPKPEYLYQDTAGTIPVTADGDPVGLMLDRSQGLELGPELWTNALASIEDDSFGSTGTYTPSTGVFTNTGTGTSTVRPRFNFTCDISPNSHYDITLNISGTTANIAGTSGSIHVGPSTSSFRTISFTFPAVGDSLSITSRLRSDVDDDLIRIVTDGAVGDWEFTLDNISVRELPGNHASQSVSASRPIYKTAGLLQQYDGVDDAMDVTLPSIPAATVITAKATGVEVQYPVDLSAGSYTINASHSGIIIREGQLSASEEQDAINYLSTQQGVA